MPPRPSAAELSSGARLDAVAYCIHFVGGVAMLAPWNAMSTAGDYFDAVLAPHPVARLTTAAYLPPPSSSLSPSWAATRSPAPAPA